MVTQTEKVLFLCSCYSTTLVPSLNHQNCCSGTTSRRKEAEWRQNHCHGGSRIAMLSEWRHSGCHNDCSMNAIGQPKEGQWWYKGGRSITQIDTQFLQQYKFFFTGSPIDRSHVTTAIWWPLGVAEVSVTCMRVCWVSHTWKYTQWNIFLFESSDESPYWTNPYHIGFRHEASLNFHTYFGQCHRWVHKKAERLPWLFKDGTVAQRSLRRLVTHRSLKGGGRKAHHCGRRMDAQGSAIDRSRYYYSHLGAARGRGSC